MVINIKEQIVQNGQVKRGQLGIEIQDVRPALVKAFKLKDGQGALISGVASHSPAELAGIQEGDVIIRINGVTVRNSSNLKSMIANMRMGAKVDMEYVRDGLILQGKATIGEVSPASFNKGKNGIKPPKAKYYEDPWNF